MAASTAGAAFPTMTGACCLGPLAALAPLVNYAAWPAARVEHDLGHRSAQHDLSACRLQRTRESIAETLRAAANVTAP